MKKVTNLFVLVVILALVLTSCTKDISGPVDLNFTEGKWNFDKSTVSSGIITLPYTTDYLKNEDGCAKDYIELLAGGVAKSGDYTSGCAFEQKTGTWSISGTNLVMSVAGSGIDGTFAIASLSATQLILKVEGNYEGKSGTLNLYFTK
jgi:hypothetical protein